MFKEQTPGSKDAYARLAKLPEIVEILPPKHDVTELQQSLDELRPHATNKFTQKSVESIQMLIDSLQTPMIVDTFTDHLKRRDWRHALAKQDPELGKLYEKNKLRKNRLTSVLGMIEPFRTGFLDDEEILTFTKEQEKKIRECLETHDGVTTPEFVYTFDDLSFQIATEMLALLEDRLQPKNAE